MTTSWRYPAPHAPAWPAPVYDLRPGRADTVLREIGADPGLALGSPSTHCRLECRAGELLLVVTADDPEPGALIATVSPPDSDQFLYEEDCLQLAVAVPDAPRPVGFLLLNARGTRRGSGTGKTWTVTATPTASGWEARLVLPLPPGTPCFGLSLHRFYRGIKGEVQSLAPTLPHPLDLAAFAAIVVAGSTPAVDAAAEYRRGVVTAADRETERVLAACRQRVARTAAQPTPDFLTLAKDLVPRRLAMPLNESEGFLCWNEGHFQQALLDLFELTDDTHWLDLLPPRIEQVWTLTGKARSASDSSYGKPLPTWYNDTESGTACTLVSGVILGPIARFIRLLHDRPEMRGRFAARVEPWVRRCEEVVAWHDFEWVAFPDGSGMHLEPYGKGQARVYPRGGSRINPLNREFFLTMAMLDLAQVTGNPEYRRKAMANALYFRRVCDLRNGCLGWEYETQACPATGEDISHAAVQVMFLEQCVRDDVLFTDADLRLAANTLVRQIFQYGDVPAAFIRGGDPALDVTVASWSSLCRFVPEVLPRIERVVATAVHEGHRLFDGSGGYGIRVLTMVAKAQRAGR